MDARIKLAILDHNNNVNRKQATVQSERKGSEKKGEKQWKFVSSKLSKEWVTKERKTPKSFSFVNTLLREVLSRKEKAENLNQKVSELVGRLVIPKNIAYTEKPQKQSILEKQYTIQRFKK